MTPRTLIATLITTWAFSACTAGTQTPTSSGGHAGDQTQTEEYERGPHRGRMLRAGDFALELQIFEEGVPPEFHVYLSRSGKPLPPTAANVRVELERLGNIVDRFEFQPQGDYLLGDGVVTEPHSFAVRVYAEVDGQQHTWAYDSFEGRTSIPEAIAQQAGIRTEITGPARIAESLRFTGRLVPHPGRFAELSGRYPGEITELHVRLGDRVSKDQKLLTIRSTDSLQEYALLSPLEGQITKLSARVGELAGETPLVTVMDLRELWADVPVFARDLTRLTTGQPVRLQSTEGDRSLEGRIEQIVPAEGPGGMHHAHVRVDNTEGLWHPGQFVNASVRVAESSVPLAVKRSALQGFRDFTVVFAQVEDTYEVRMLELGRQDETWVEVLGGIAPGVRYVTENSYLLKADVEKSGASHDH